MWFLLVLVLAIISCATPDAERAPVSSSDYLFVNAKIYSDLADGSDAVRVQRTKITQVGHSEDLQKSCTGPCQMIDVHGKFLMPGFHDAHIHLIDAARGFFDQIEGSSIKAIQRSLRVYAGEHSEKTWIYGGSWNYQTFKNNLPTKEDLDIVESKRPVALRDFSGHQLWVNSRALEMAGINKETPDPKGGTIVRDQNGNPTGILLETANYSVRGLMPKPTLEEYEKYILKGEEQTMALGLTSTEGASIPLTLEQVQAYIDLDKKGLLKQRTFLWGSLVAPPRLFYDMVDLAKSLPKDGKIQIVAFKGFVDGVLSAETAGVLEPYEDHPQNRGLLKLNQEQLNHFVLRANQAGFPAALHAMGDKAIQMTLNAFEYSQKTLGKKFPNRVEHATFVAEKDFSRFKELGAIASVQPNFMYSKNATVFPYLTSLGPERIHRLYPWKTLQDAGAFLIFGSDHPDGGISHADPLTGIYCATQRVFQDGTPFTPDQRLDIETALKAYTVNPAIAIGMGDHLGKIQVGYDADLIVLAKDPRSVVAKSIKDDPLKMIMVDGQLTRLE